MESTVCLHVSDERNPLFIAAFHFFFYSIDKESIKSMLFRLPFPLPFPFDEGGLRGWKKPGERAARLPLIGPIMLQLLPLFLQGIHLLFSGHDRDART